MNSRLPACTGMPAATWLAAGVAFLAVGVRQPAFVGIGAAYVAIGIRQLRGRNREP